MIRRKCCVLFVCILLCSLTACTKERAGEGASGTSGWTEESVAAGTSSRAEESAAAGTSDQAEESAAAGENGIPAETAGMKTGAGEEGRMAAYRCVLQDIYHSQIFPDGNNYGLSEYHDISENRFAVLDIDKDGHDELIIEYTTTIMAGMVEIIYDYDREAGAVREEFFEFPSITFYDNGILEAGWSHNQGLAGDFWPYNLYRYDQASDTYLIAANVDAWDRALSETDRDGNSFPEETDVNGDGIVYYIMTNGDYEYNTPVDWEEYSAWRDSYLHGAAVMDIPFMNLTEDNIDSIQSFT